MTRKIGIIGLGHVGATLAHSMVLKHTCDHLVLIDTNEKKVKSDALDFCDMVANTGYPVHITVNDYAALQDADVVVSTLGNIELQANNTNDRFAELPFTSKQVVQVGRDLKASGFHGVLVVVTNPVDAVTQLYQQYTGLSKEQVIGTGTLLDTARMKRAVADRLQVNTASVSLAITLVNTEILNLSLGAKFVSRDMRSRISSHKKSWMLSTMNPCEVATLSSLVNSIPTLGLRQQRNV